MRRRQVRKLVNIGGSIYRQEGKLRSTINRYRNAGYLIFLGWEIEATVQHAAKECLKRQRSKPNERNN